MKITTLVLQKNKITDFAKERNILLQQSKTDWNLFLDQDEQIDTKIKPQSFNYSSYFLTRKNYFLNQYVGKDKLIRLVKKNSGHWKRRVHEVFVPKGKAGYLPNVIIHHTATNLKSYINKIDYYSGLHALANKEEGKKANLFKVVFYPLLKFITTLLKSRNIVFSIMQSLHSFLSWSKLLLYYS